MAALASAAAERLDRDLVPFTEECVRAMWAWQVASGRLLACAETRR